MNANYSDYDALKIIEKVQDDLKEIEVSCIDHSTKRKIKQLLNYLEEETTNNKAVFIEMLLHKIKLTKKLYPDVNTNLYILYRNLITNKISMEDAQNIYKMYSREISI